MATRNVVMEASALLDLAQTLTPLQRQIILALHDCGPGLLLEIAVRQSHGAQSGAGRSAA